MATALRQMTRTLETQIGRHVPTTLTPQASG
jgi:hypothetical protein